MKTILRIFNVFIVALSAVAMVFLFVTPTLSFKSKICLNVTQLSEFVPTTEYTGDVDFAELMGTDEIQAGLNFEIKLATINKMSNGDKNLINETFIQDNVDRFLDIIHEPVRYITEYSLKTVIRNILNTKIKEQIQNGIDNLEIDSGITKPTASDIMDEAGMDYYYFNNLVNKLYSEADKGDATVSSLSNILFVQIDNSLAVASESRMVDTSGFTEEVKDSIKENFTNTLKTLKLIDDDGNVIRISEIAYVYFADFLVSQLDEKVEFDVLIKQDDESQIEYSDRLTKEYVYTLLPTEFYDVLSKVALGLLIALIVFAAMWGFLIIYTIFKSMTSRPWTLFGPWFWVLGAIQTILGLGLLIFSKMIFPMLAERLSFYASTPINSILFSVRTCLIAASIIYIVLIVVAFIYGFFKRRAKRMMKEE